MDNTSFPVLRSASSTTHSSPKITRNLTLDGSYERAYDRARQANHKAWQIGPTTYRVCSFTTVGVAYDVWVTTRGLSCNCPAGQARQVCKHAALVSLRLQREHKSADLNDWFAETDDTSTDADLEQAFIEALPLPTPAPAPRKPTWSEVWCD